MSRPLKEELLPVRSPSDVSDSEKEEKVPVDKRAAAVGIFICLAAVALVVVLIVYYSARKSATIHYDVTATRLSNEPMVSGPISDFDYSYNPASFVVGDQRYLLVRVQNYNHSVGPYAVGTFHGEVPDQPSIRLHWCGRRSINDGASCCVWQDDEPQWRRHTHRVRAEIPL